MIKKLCIEEGCETAQHARKLCNKHYLHHRNHGTLDDVSPSTKHRLTNINEVSGTGDCSLCGPNGEIFSRGGRWRCQLKTKHFDRNVLTYGEGQTLSAAFLNTLYDELYAEQQGLCASCNKPPLDGKPLVVDHCHTTGKVRGLLHGTCNSGIGLLGDNVEGLQAALSYLLKSIAD